MATVFWDPRGIIYTDYLEKGQTITGAYYASLLHRLSEEIKKKRPHLKKILFHQENASCHKSFASMAKLHELHFELLPHRPYFSELAPSDFYLYADLNRMFQRKRFVPNQEVISGTEDKSFYKKDIEMLEKRWNECITLEKDLNLKALK